MKIDADLPELKVVRHARAKRLKLMVDQQGIRLTLPMKATRLQVEYFLNQSMDWLVESWQKQQEKHRLQSPIALPDTINLCYQNQWIQIIYDTQATRAIWQQSDGVLVLPEENAAAYLKQFVCLQAKTILPQQLKIYAQAKGCQLNRIRVAAPKTRWGSCNARQDIMLHAGLLLMPQANADYVLYHELAHTLHMHHQAEFWDQLEQFYPNAKQHQQAVKNFKLPAWWIAN